MTRHTTVETHHAHKSARHSDVEAFGGLLVALLLSTAGALLLFALL